MQMILVLAVMIMILVPAAAGEQPVADFIAQDAQTTGFAPFTVWFEDRSTGAASWAWSFGDGETSTQPNPSHTYTGAGTWTVSLTVQDTTGTLQNTKTIPDYIVVAADPHGGPEVTTHATTTTPAVTSTTHALTGTVTVRSSPEGAMVSLDGEEKGITPITLYGVPAGSHTVLVHLKRYSDYRTSVTVEHEQTISLDVTLEPPAITTTQIPTSTTSMTPGVIETSTGEAMKAAADPEKENGQGSIRINCHSCLDRKSGGIPVKFIQYMILAVHSVDGKETKEVIFSKDETKETVIKDVPPGYYEVRVWPEEHKAQSKYVTVRPSEETVAVFNGSAFVQSPGFGALITAFTVALIVIMRRLRE